MLPEIVCPESTPAEYDPPVPQSRMSPPVVAWFRFITVWPVEEPDALTPSANDVLLFVEFAFVNTQGAVRFPVATPARVIENVAPVSVIVAAAVAPVMELSAPPPLPPAAHVQTAGFAAVQDRNVLLPDGWAIGSPIV
jgi:hypothetical protein